MGKEFTHNAGDTGSIPESGRSPGGGRGQQLQYACLENRIDRGAWQTAAHGDARSETKHAGTHTASGKPGCLHSSECPRTYSWDNERLSLSLRSTLSWEFA